MDEEGVRVVLLVNVSPPEHAVGIPTQYARLVSLSCLRVLAFFSQRRSAHDGIPVAWAYRFYKPRQCGDVDALPSTTFAPFDSAEDIVRLEKELLDRLECDKETKTTRHRRYIDDVVLQLTRLAQDYPWDGPDVVFSSKRRRSRSRKRERDVFSKRFVFVVQPIPNSEAEWSRLWGANMRYRFEGEDAATLTTRFFGSPLIKELGERKHIRVHWIDTSTELSVTNFRFMTEMNAVLAPLRGSVIPASSLVRPLVVDQVSALCVSATIAPSTILEALIYPSSTSTMATKEQFTSLDRRGEFLCTLGLRPLRNGTPSCVQSLAMESVVSVDVTNSFLFMDLLDLNESMLCVGYEEAKDVCLTSSSRRTHSSHFRDLMYLLRLKRICLIVHSPSAVARPRYLLEPITGNVAALHVLKKDPPMTSDSTSLSPPLDHRTASGPFSFSAFPFSSLFTDSFFSLSPDCGLESSTKDWLLSEVRVETPWNRREIFSNLRSFYDKLSQKNVDEKGNVGTVLDRKLLSFYEEFVRGENDVCEEELVSRLADALKYVSSKELSDFVKGTLLRSADALKSVQENGSTKRQMYRAQLTLRFELGLLDDEISTDEVTTLFRAFRFVVDGEEFHGFLGRAFKRYTSPLIRSCLSSVCDRLMLRSPDDTSLKEEESSDCDSDADRVILLETECLMKHRSDIGPPSGPAAPQPPSSGSQRKFVRHQSFHDFGQPKRILVNLRQREKKDVEMIAKRTRSAQKKRVASETSPKKEKKRTNVRRSLFSESGLLTRSRTRLDDGNAVSSREAKAKKSPQKPRIMAKDTPLKRQSGAITRSRVASGEVASVCDTPKRKFYSREVVSRRRRDDGSRSGIHLSSPMKAHDSDMASLMFREQEQILSPACASLLPNPQRIISSSSIVYDFHGDVVFDDGGEEEAAEERKETIPKDVYFPEDEEIRDSRI